MGEAKRRKQLDPNYGKPKKQLTTLLLSRPDGSWDEFVGDWSAFKNGEPFYRLYRRLERICMNVSHLLTEIVWESPEAIHVYLSDEIGILEIPVINFDSVSILNEFERIYRMKPGSEYVAIRISSRASRHCLFVKSSD